MLQDLVGLWTYWWDQLLNYYRVNPLVFVVMYSAKSVVFWWTVVLIVQRARRRDWDSLPGLVLLNVSTNVSPWVYVWFCGRNLPGWYPYMVYALAAYGLGWLVWYVRRKLRQFAGPEPVLRRPARKRSPGRRRSPKRSR